MVLEAVEREENMEIRTIYLITAIIWLVLTWLIIFLPPSYYQLLRFFICGAGVCMAYLAYKQKKILFAWLLGITALWINPFKPLGSGPSTYLDICKGIAVLFLTFLALIDY